MRITRALLPVAALAFAIAPPASGGRPGLAIHGWVVPARTVPARTMPAPTAAIRPLPLARLPLTLGYSWAQPPSTVITTLTPLTLAQLPVLTTYPWAQPRTAPRHVLHGEPWSL